MTSQEAWNNIVQALIQNPGDYRTVPRVNRRHRWFYAWYEGNAIQVEKARKTEPSCKINKSRNIYYGDFSNVFPYYERWRNGEVGIRNEVRMISRNSTYIFALITRFCSL
jgi:hypothetical protein